MATASEHIADFIASVTYEDIPQDVVDATKLHLLDALGCGLAAHGLGVGSYALATMLEESHGGPASVIGHPAGLPAPAAAFVNGVLCHALDFDDTHPDAICHISAVTVPAAAAAAETCGVDGRALLTALAAANEVVIRIGSAAAPAYMRTGFHPTSVCGVFGAAAASARLAELDVHKTVHALGIVGSMASGIFEYLGDGSTTKALHPGLAAQAGLRAANLAVHGATGPASVLEGRFGVLRTYFRLEPDAVGPLVATLGERWETPQIAFKPFPACHFVHSCLDAAARATATVAIVPEDIEGVVVTVPAPAVPLVLEPRDAKVAPRTDYDAKFSLQYAVAAMLVHRRVGLDTFSASALEDKSVLAIAKRITHEVKEYETYPGAFPGGIRISMRSGDIFAAELLHQRGSAEHPMTASEVVEKYRENAALALGDAEVDALLGLIFALEEVADVRPCFAPLGAARNPRPPEAAWTS